MSKMEQKIRYYVSSPDKMDNVSFDLFREKTITEKISELIQEDLDLDDTLQQVKSHEKSEKQENLMPTIEAYIKARKDFIQRQCRELKSVETEAKKANHINKEIMTCVQQLTATAHADILRRSTRTKVVRRR